MSRKKNKARFAKGGSASLKPAAAPGKGAPGLMAHLWTAAGTALAGFGAVYLIFAGAGAQQNPPSAQPGTATTAPQPANPRAAADEAAAPSSSSPAKGSMAAFVFKKSPETLPEFAFASATGSERRLADWRGKVVLLNLWATWCAPCRKEMPALDRLQKELGGADFEVVALAVDRAGVEGAKKFLNETGAESLAAYADPSARAGTLLKVLGMPTTLLIGRDGREVGRLVGPAEWDSAGAKELIRTEIARKMPD